ncbi:MAG TPA: ferritin-like domain-containing protein [Pyrinomonadaceae bacterium]|nr:ferritin-like domain-containing protein [Pyrinomonadaceae bacterium]
MSDDRKGWTPDLVREYLQNAVYLELWTIPLYLTAAYSINVPVDAATGRPEIANLEDFPKNQDGSYDFSRFTNDQASLYAFDSVLSVAIQEMLHLELAANILNAVRPEENLPPNKSWVKFTGDYAPNYEHQPQRLPTPTGLTLEFGPLDVDRLNLFQWIEQKGKDAEEERCLEVYDSIGDFYHALSYGLKVCWEELYPTGGRQSDPLQKDDWGEAMAKSALMLVRSGARGATHRLPAVLSQEIKKRLMGSKRTSDGLLTADALQKAGNYPFSIKIEGSSQEAVERARVAIDAISAQGEGAGGTDVPSQYVPTTGEAIELFFDSKSHLDRFTELQQLVHKVNVYKTELKQGDTEDDASLRFLQDVLNKSYSSFLGSIESSFASSDSVGLAAMAGLGNRTLQVWQAGGIPEYKWIDPSTYIDKTQTHHYHACQGLNIVEENGKAPGACDCATAYFHACQQTNVCKGQGGCGYQGDAKDPNDNWVPNFNNCYNLGGCGAPIPPGQVFNANPKWTQAPQDLQNKEVWEHARELLQEHLQTELPPIKEVSPIRQSLQPTSYPYPPKK